MSSFNWDYENISGQILMTQQGMIEQGKELYYIQMYFWEVFPLNMKH